MPELRIDFEWWRDPKGYRRADLDREVRSRDRVAFTPTGISIGSKLVEKPLIKRRGGKLQAYRPLELFPKLYGQFARINTPEQLMEFVERFGPLTNEGRDPRAGDPIGPLLEQSSSMRTVIAASLDPA